MSLIESTCPKCREKITVDDSREKLFCMYCGASFSFDELDEFHGNMVLQRNSENPSDPEIDPSAITVRGADNVNATVTLFVDKKAAARLRKGESVVLDVVPGRHIIWARVGIEGANKKEMELLPGDRLQIIYDKFMYDVVKS